MSINWYADANEMAGNFPPIPEGRYCLKVVKVKEGTTAKHLPKVDLEFEVTLGAYEGRKVWHTLCFIPKGEAGHGLTVQAMKALGLPFDGAVTIEASDFENRSCAANVVINEYKDKDGHMRKNNKIATAGFVTDDGPGAPTAEQLAAATPEQKAAMTAEPAPAPAATGGKSKPRF